MSMTKSIAAALALGLCPATAAFAAPAQPANPAPVWWGHVAALADDSLQGRLPGTPGYDTATRYVAARLKDYGVRPFGGSSYLHPVRLVEQKVIAERSSVALVAGGAATPLTLGEDLILGARIAQPASIEAPLVFIGYGLHIPRFGHDDFAGQDLRGKILVAINGGPAALPGAVKSGARAAETWRAIERVGALGLISLPTPRSMDIPWARQRLLAANAGMYLAEPALQDAKAPRFTATLNPEQAEKVFARSGRTYKELLALADAGGAITGFPLNVSIQAAVAAETKTLTSPNIVGVLPGSDPKLAREYVVISAHLDHLGVGAEIGGDRIYNGAMDDASGVASVLEVARELGAARQRPRRSVLFALFTAEEKGLLGSRAFAEGAPRGALVADLNIDMALPLWPLTSLYMPGGEESSLGREAATVAATHGYRIVPDPCPDRNVFTRTDQFSFVRAGVPAVALKFGFLPSTPEAAVERAWRAERYHSPSDDLAQPIDLNAAARFNDYVRDLAVHLANLPAPPQWAPTSIFAPARATAD